jgi:hypothetical protein
MPIRGVAVPFVYGDGIRDDAPGVNAALRGDPYIDLTGGVKTCPDTGYCAISNVNFSIRQRIVFPERCDAVLVDFTRPRRGEFCR